MDLKSLEDVVKCQAEDLMSHNNRICSIELNNARVDVQIQSLVKSVDRLVDTVKIVFIGALFGSVAFVVWYLQQQ